VGNNRDWNAEAAELLDLLNTPRITHDLSIRLISAWLDVAYVQGKIVGAEELDKGIQTIISEKRKAQ
jgi:hypothetical protein